MIKRIITNEGIANTFINNQFSQEKYSLEERDQLRSRLTKTKGEIYLDKTFFVCAKLVQGRLETITKTLRARTCTQMYLRCMYLRRKTCTPRWNLIGLGQIFEHLIVWLFLLLLFYFFNKCPGPIKRPIQTSTHPIAFVFRQLVIYGMLTSALYMSSSIKLTTDFILLYVIGNILIEVKCGNSVTDLTLRTIFQ